ncbi:hypothetical protein EVAR_46730_1 [Eumeta japonica]|uniref:Uncharacterized protein n=1 Tax=Eumeta variegata TaxID=151549 RepID=A0A4C1X9M9_EUMVA|nr:hypothetical protein EVAR_46730_1 [Eumeta japonica]
MSSQGVQLLLRPAYFRSKGWELISPIAIHPSPTPDALRGFRHLRIYRDVPSTRPAGVGRGSIPGAGTCVTMPSRTPSRGPISRRISAPASRHRSTLIFRFYLIRVHAIRRVGYFKKPVIPRTSAMETRDRHRTSNDWNEWFLLELWT